MLRVKAKQRKKQIDVYQILIVCSSATSGSAGERLRFQGSPSGRSRLALSENIDFFKGDDPRSIANKILTISLSDLSAMGAEPNAYLLNLFIPNYIDEYWIKIFTNELLKIQKMKD